MRGKRYRWMVALLLGLLAAGSGSGEEGFRIFTSADGRSIEARITEYNAVRNKLRIERRDKGSAWVAPDVFCKEDREYIKQWISASLFLAESNLKVSLKKTKIANFGSKKSHKETNNIGFEVKLQNRSKEPVNISGIEYRYYVRTVRTGAGKDSERSEEGRLNAGTLKASQTQVLTTSSLSLYTTYREQVETTQSYSGGVSIDRSIVKVSEDELRGIWIRIYGPKVDGRRLFRDVTYPKNLREKAAWMPVSRNQGE